MNQSAFISGIQTLDSILIANELVDEYKWKKKRGSVIKLDFEKAYDMVKWNFWLDVLRNKSFGERWKGLKNWRNLPVISFRKVLLKKTVISL